MKKLLCLLLSICMIFGLTGCSSVNGTTKALFKGIKKCDEKILDKLYFGDPQDSVIHDFIDIIEECESLDYIGDIISEYIMDFEYKVVDKDVDGDYATVKVKITTENWAVIVPNLALLVPTKMVTMTLDGKSEKQIEKELKKLVKEQRKKTDDVDYLVELNLIKVDGEWKVDLSECCDELVEAISGGLY